MEAFITITDTTVDHEIKRFDFDNEEIAQLEFDAFTYNGSEWGGQFQWDLIALHPVYGELIRRTMYTNEPQ